MGANMGKPSTYTYGFPPKRRSSNAENSNDFSKDYWGPNPMDVHSNSKVVSSEFWMVDSEKQYRKEVFHPIAENVYASASSYRNRNNFESPFTFTKPSEEQGSAKTLRDIPYSQSYNHGIGRPPPPYTSRSSAQPTRGVSQSKYLPGCAAET